MYIYIKVRAQKNGLPSQAGRSKTEFLQFHVITSRRFGMNLSKLLIPISTWQYKMLLDNNISLVRYPLDTVVIFHGNG